MDGFSIILLLIFVFLVYTSLLDYFELRRSDLYFDFIFSLYKKYILLVEVILTIIIAIAFIVYTFVLPEQYKFGL